MDPHTVFQAVILAAASMSLFIMCVAAGCRGALTGAETLIDYSAGLIDAIDMVDGVVMAIVLMGTSVLCMYVSWVFFPTADLHDLLVYAMTETA